LRDVAGNTFPAAAGQYWLGRTQPEEETARPLRGLIKLIRGTHVAVGTIAIGAEGPGSAGATP